MGFVGADGKFYKGQPAMTAYVPQRTTVWKQADHDRQRADHKADLIKPYNPDGTPNEEFIRVYRKESIEIYKFVPSDDEILKEH